MECDRMDHIGISYFCVIILMALFGIVFLHLFGLWERKFYNMLKKIEEEAEKHPEK